jgi:hypothetical protein
MESQLSIVSFFIQNPFLSANNNLMSSKAPTGAGVKDSRNKKDPRYGLISPIS